MELKMNDPLVGGIVDLRGDRGGVVADPMHVAAHTTTWHDRRYKKHV